MADATPKTAAQMYRAAAEAYRKKDKPEGKALAKAAEMLAYAEELEKNTHPRRPPGFTQVHPIGGASEVHPIEEGYDHQAKTIT